MPIFDRPINQRRPAVVVAAGSIEADHGLLWILMITSAENWRAPVCESHLSFVERIAPSVAEPLS